MNYIEMSFLLTEKDPYSDIVIAKLNEIGFESYLKNPKGVQAYIQKSMFHEETLDSVIKELKSLFEFDVVLKEIERINWNKKWEESFNPVYVNDDCIVRPDFFEPSTDYRYEIVISPKMSFGTGHHETTFLMMNHMFELELNDTSVLDIGCGTGILSILAEMLGSTRILGIDIDRWSYENSLENASINGSKLAKFRLCNVSEISESFDVILANISSNIIISDIVKYFDLLNPEGNCLVSGFLSSDIKDIKYQAENVGFKLDSHQYKNEWHLLNFIK